MRFFWVIAIYLSVLVVAGVVAVALCLGYGVSPQVPGGFVFLAVAALCASAVTTFEICIDRQLSSPSAMIRYSVKNLWGTKAKAAELLPCARAVVVPKLFLIPHGGAFLFHIIRFVKPDDSKILDTFGSTDKKVSVAWAKEINDYIESEKKHQLIIAGSEKSLGKQAVAAFAILGLICLILGLINPL